MFNNNSTITRNNLFLLIIGKLFNFLHGYVSFDFDLTKLPNITLLVFIFMSPIKQTDTYLISNCFSS